MSETLRCAKVAHSRGAYLHGADDDSPHDVDGVQYCGRCHVALSPGETHAAVRVRMVNGFPRRNRVDLYTRAEAAISKAVQVVEQAGAHTLLTDAVILLGQAQQKVADYVDLLLDAPPLVECWGCGGFGKYMGDGGAGGTCNTCKGRGTVSTSPASRGTNE